MESECLNCSLGKFRQLMMIMLYQEIFEVGNDFEKCEILVVKSIEYIKENNTGRGSLRTWIVIENISHKTEEERAGSTGLVNHGESPQE